MKTLQTIISIALFYWSPLSVAHGEEVRIQFFGDTFLSYYAMTQSKTTVSDPRMFQEVRGLLEEADLNIVNFEGVATHAFVPYQLKRFVLQMPLRSAVILRKVGIHAATLANNHVLDYGIQGMFDTFYAMDRVGIRYFGAGFSAEEANKPLILTVGDLSFCFFSLSRTLPSSFWAKGDAPGTSHLSYEDTAAGIEACVNDGHITIPVFHWGEELAPVPKAYQVSLAKLAVKSGAAAVIGHHPHVLQDIHFVAGTPVLYSIGNFAFGTLSGSNKQEGLAAQLVTDGKSTRMELIPLNVSNRETNFVVRPITDPTLDPIKARLPEKHPCVWHQKKTRWVCGLPSS